MIKSWLSRRTWLEIVTVIAVILWLLLTWFSPTHISRARPANVERKTVEKSK
jgi:MFS-type transporter involved in bile tolerance (Atg22 family)